MSATPEDLVETWQLIAANGDEPVEWMMDEAMWDAVVMARDERAAIDAGDHLAEESGMTLLGTPVEITGTSVPLLRFRRAGELFGTPILGETTGPTAAQRHAHSTGPRPGSL